MIYVMYKEEDMKQYYYLYRSGRLQRKDNTLEIVYKDNTKKSIPVERVDDIYVMTELDFNTNLLNFLSLYGINIHFFNYYGFYTGTYCPKESLVSGKLLIKQVEYYNDIEKRVKNPPDNAINSLISYVNTIIYTRVLNEIYKTQLNPTISYLHEPSERRFSLCLDIAEIFKPIIADRLIFSMLNKKQITEKNFEDGLNFTYIKDKARKEITREVDLRLQTKIKHKKLGREVSYEYLMRLEVYKLIKQFLEDEKYEGFKMWW